MNKNELYRSIPKVDVLIEREEIQGLIQVYGREIVLDAIRIKTEELRFFIGNEMSEECVATDKENKNETYKIKEAEVEKRIAHLCASIRGQVEQIHEPNMRRVINGTGTILHTNLGRAVIGKAHMEQVGRIATGYSNLEYNLEEGKRGERYSHFEELLCKVTGGEAAMAVNNNAAAVMLILNALGKGQEVVVSRGELVEIGGKFRIPDVMEISGAKLKEIGTTNKTHLRDYEEAISENTGVLLKVHTSNYRILGFTTSVSMEELVPLGNKYDIPVVEDLGSGVLVDISKYGLAYEPTVQDALRNGADVVCFSGDKLLGGPQAGIVVGKKKYIDKMKQSQLTRALRIDKFTAAALEAVLQEYLSEEKAVKHIPVLRMMTKTLDEVTRDAQDLMKMLLNDGNHKIKEESEDVKARLEKDIEEGIEEGIQEELQWYIRLGSCESQIGGGSLPLERIPSMGIVLKHGNLSTARVEIKLRALEVPIICRIINDEILLDVRTIDKDDFALLVTQLLSIED